jgi:hypothetical protein
LKESELEFGSVRSHGVIANHDTPGERRYIRARADLALQLHGMRQSYTRVILIWIVELIGLYALQLYFL